jgi:hypothetical protein
VRQPESGSQKAYVLLIFDPSTTLSCHGNGRECGLSLLLASQCSSGSLLALDMGAADVFFNPAKRVRVKQTEGALAGSDQSEATECAT